MENITTVIKYYTARSKRMLKIINQNDYFTVDQIIEIGKELEILEYKITALEIANLEANIASK